MLNTINNTPAFKGSIVIYNVRGIKEVPATSPATTTSKDDKLIQHTLDYFISQFEEGKETVSLSNMGTQYINSMFKYFSKYNALNLHGDYQTKIKRLPHGEYEISDHRDEYSNEASLKIIFST